LRLGFVGFDEGASIVAIARVPPPASTDHRYTMRSTIAVEMSASPVRT
jgi:hypothetical protein